MECSVVEMEVFDLDNENRVDLPKVYSTRSLSIRPECIREQEDIDHWPYLKGITVEKSTLLSVSSFGSDVPEMLQPEEVRMREKWRSFRDKNAVQLGSLRTYFV